MIDIISENVNLLKNLGFAVEHWDFVLFNTLLGKLDASLRQRFERTCTQEELPTYQQLLSFLEIECTSQEMTHTGCSKAKRRDKDPAAFMAKVSGGNGICPLCKGKHGLMVCERFLSFTPRDRSRFVQDKRLCLVCLRGGHRASFCTENRCEVCGKPHHKLLHFGQTGGGPTTVLTNSATTDSIVLLATAVVEIRDNTGHYQPVRVLLDSGSQANFVTRQCCQRLGVRASNSAFSVLGLGGQQASVTGTGAFQIRSRYTGGQDFLAEMFVLPRVCGTLPEERIDISQWHWLQGIALADPTFYRPGAIDMLLGADLFGRVFTGQKREGKGEEPVALQTIFGWCILGRVLGQGNRRKSLSLHVQATREAKLEVLVQRFWEVDQYVVPGISGLTAKKVEAQFVESYERQPDGRFVVSLPFQEGRRDPGNFPGSREIAVKRFVALEHRLKREPELYATYKDAINEYLAEGHMTPVPIGQKEVGYYIPHFPVVKPTSQTTKVRIVFDASTRARNGISLNDVLEVGPSLQIPIVAILWRFRFHAVAITSDVKQMYRQVLVKPEDRVFQKIVWREEDSAPFQDFWLNTVTFGVASSPFLAMRSVQELARIEHARFPRASETLLSDLYMDDVVSGASTTSEAQTLQHELIDIFAEAKFELRKWASNDPALLEGLDQGIDHQVAVSFGNGEIAGVKVLGMEWRPEQDCFCYATTAYDRSCTKRNVLSTLARIFDPVGLISPVIFIAKALIQRLWILGLEWDAPVPGLLRDQWLRFTTELEMLRELRIPRCVKQEGVTEVQLHGFCDASEKGYAAVLYLRTTQVGGQVICSLLTSRSKVAPLKRLSIPRLELCAAVLLAELLSAVQKECQGQMGSARLHAWSDSMVVLAWLRSPSAGFKQFVGNRIGRIQEAVNADIFRHVPTEWNPADVASRGALPAELLNLQLWWQGPPWLSENEEKWPQQVREQVRTPEEESKQGWVLVSVGRGDPWWLKFSSLRTIQATAAWCLRFIYNCRARLRGEEVRSGALTSRECQEGLLRIVKEVQSEVFSAELSKLSQGGRLPKAWSTLGVFLDKSGVLRVGGRLGLSELQYQTKFPMLLPRKHPLTDRIIDNYHHGYLHPGIQTTCYLLRQNFWIFSVRRAVISRVRNCTQCFKAHPKSLTPYMADLPSSRVLRAKAFSKVGVDFAGPFLLRPVRGRGRTSFKSYVCVFVCHVTKAIHIELVFDMTANAFIAALRRFVARRGLCVFINTDNGTNFVGASRLLRRLFQEAASAERIEFRFNPPSAPHFGGLFEAGVKSIKTHLHRVVGKQTLTVEEFLTLLAQVEATLNSRPLWTVSSDPTDLEALSPGHFLTLAPISALPDPNVLDCPVSALSRWQFIQRLNQDFWKRWSREYLTTLHQRYKWREKGGELLKGSLVLIKDDQARPLNWELARVVEVHPGRDGIIRVATVQTKRGRFQRPLVRLCPLPNNTEEEQVLKS